MAPSWSRRAVCAIAFAGCFLLAPEDAGAADPLGIVLRYEAPSGCPSRAQLADELRARVDEGWLRGADRRTFDVRITREGAAYAGRLEIAQPDRAPRIRQIRAATCPAVVTSIAVFLAIALDPTSEPESSEPAPPTASDAPQVHAPPETVVTPPTRPAPKTTTPAPKPIWIWSAGYQATYLHAPEAAWGGRVHGELSRTFERERLAPALRISWGFSSFSTFPDRGGEAKFRLKTVRVEGCARVDLSPILAAACGGVDVGALSGDTPALRGSVRETTRWIAAAALLRAAWAITSWLSVGAEVSVFVPFERTSFALSNPVRLVYRAPAVLFGGGAGLGVTARFR